MKTVNHTIAVILWVVGLAMLAVKSSPIWGVLVFIPVVLGVQLVTHVGIYRANSTRSQAVLLSALLGYFAWFVGVYTWVFYYCRDPQCPIALVFTGIYALPILIPLWAMAYFLEK